MSSVFNQSFKAIGTTWNIDFTYIEGITDALGVFVSITDRIEEFEQQYSRFRTDSLLSKIATQAGDYKLLPDAKNLLLMYRKLYNLSEGKVTPLIGKILVDAGYDSEYSLTPKKVIEPIRIWDDVMSYDEHSNTLTTFIPIQLDFGGLGKGYIIDIVCKMLIAAGITDFTVDAGGDMYHKGEQIRIGLEHPDNPEQVIGVAEIIDGSICGSSGNRRTWSTYHHIINPLTRESPSDIKALWVVAKSAFVADGLTTALFFTDPDKLKKEFDFEYVIVKSDGSAYISPNFPGSLF